MKSDKPRTGQSERTIKKHEKIRELFQQRYVHQERVNGAKKYTREYVIAKLSEEYYYSMRQIENIIYTKPKPNALPAAGAAPAAPAAAQRPLAA